MVYVVVAVGVTGIFVLLRFGYTKFNPAIAGVIVANTPLLYDHWRIAVCPADIVGVVVVSEHGGILSITFNIHVHVACSVSFCTIIVNVYCPVCVAITELTPLN